MNIINLRILALTCAAALSSVSVFAMGETNLCLNEKPFTPIVEHLVAKSEPTEGRALDLNHGVIQEIIPNKVYVSSGLATSGEPIYFGMEFVDQNNQTKWEIYRQKSEYVARFYISSTLLSKERRQAYFEISGYEKQEYESFCDYIHEKASKRTPEENDDLRESYEGAIGAFNVYANPRTYVAYISKIPITGYFNHPDKPDTFKGYHEGYENLLMCVRCKDIPDTVVYNNRAIFKGLRNFVAGGYGGLAIKLHGFTAAVFETKGKTHMSVAPLPTMYEILKAKIPEGKLLTGENIPKDLNYFGDGYGFRDKQCVIDIQTLKRSHFL